MDVEQWEITDETGAVFTGERDFILERWELAKTGRLPVRFLGEVRLIKIIKVLRPVQ